jgi:tetratricopeptide (TPR) repeat protein
MALAFAEVNPNTLGTVGVLLGQEVTPVRIASLQLAALDPIPQDPEREAALQQALAVTAEAAKHYAAGQFDAALTPAIEAVLRWRKARGEGSVDVSNAANNLGQVQLATNNLADALSSFAAALEIRQKKLGDAHPLTALIHILMAKTLRTQGKEDEARGHLEAAVSVFEDVYGKDSNAARTLRGELAPKKP